MKLTFLLVFSILGAATLHAQPLQRFYGGTGDDYFQEIKLKLDGTLIAVGAWESPEDSVRHISLTLLSATGDVLWSKKYDAPIAGAHEFGHSVISTPDGGYLVVGATTIAPENVFPPVNGAVSIKTDPSGNLQWRNLHDEAHFNDLYCAFAWPNGDGYLLGGHQGYGAGEDTQLRFLNSSGAERWTTVWEYGTRSRLKGIFLKPNSDNLLLCGRTELVGSAWGGYYVAETLSNGDTLWVRHFDTNWSELGWASPFGPPQPALPMGAAMTSDGTLYVATPGSTVGTGLDVVTQFAVFSSEGEVLLQKAFGEQGDEIYALQIAPDNNLVLAGRTGSNSGLAMKITPSGTVLWRKTFGTVGANNVFYSTAVAPDGSCFFAGSSTDHSGFGIDQWLVKTNSSGVLAAPENEGADFTAEIFPNPTSGYFNISFLEKTPKHITIFNAIGQAIERRDTPARTEVFGLPGKGVFFVEAVFLGGRTAILRVVAQ